MCTSIKHTIYTNKTNIPILNTTLYYYIHNYCGSIRTSQFSIFYKTNSLEKHLNLTIISILIKTMGIDSDDDFDVEGAASTSLSNDDNISDNKQQEQVILLSSTVKDAATSDRDGPLSKRSAASATLLNRELTASSVMNDKRIKRLRKKKQTSEHSPLVKYGSLCLLVAQLVGLVMLMRYSRTHSPNGKDLYLSSTAVFCMEVSCPLEKTMELL